MMDRGFMTPKEVIKFMIARARRTILEKFLSERPCEIQVELIVSDFSSCT